MLFESFRRTTFALFVKELIHKSSPSFAIQEMKNHEIYNNRSIQFSSIIKSQLQLIFERANKIGMIKVLSPGLIFNWEVQTIIVLTELGLLLINAKTVPPVYTSSSSINFYLCSTSRSLT